MLNPMKFIGSKIKAVRIAILKWRCKALIEAIDAHEQSYSCGRDLAHFISADLDRMTGKFRELYAKLMALDPKAPALDDRL